MDFQRERFLEGNGEQWRFREMDAHRTPGARGPSCLICESGMVVRRFWDYPANWYALPDEALLKICVGPPESFGNRAARANDGQAESVAVA